jgi:hypothetical protein
MEGGTLRVPLGRVENRAGNAAGGALGNLCVNFDRVLASPRLLDRSQHRGLGNLCGSFLEQFTPQSKTPSLRSAVKWSPASPELARPVFDADSFTHSPKGPPRKTGPTLAIFHDPDEARDHETAEAAEEHAQGQGGEPQQQEDQEDEELWLSPFKLLKLASFSSDADSTALHPGGGAMQPRSIGVRGDALSNDLTLSMVPPWLTPQPKRGGNCSPLPRVPISTSR